MEGISLSFWQSTAVFQRLLGNDEALPLFLQARGAEIRPRFSFTRIEKTPGNWLVGALSIKSPAFHYLWLVWHTESGLLLAVMAIYGQAAIRTRKKGMWIGRA
jgi:hypothetical protein